VAVTTTVSGHEVAARIRAHFPNAVIEEDDVAVVVRAEDVIEVGRFLRDDPELDCKYLNNLTAVDWLDHFDVVYSLSSMARNHVLTMKARASRESAMVPTVTSVWQGANLQEREVFDLMGVRFEGHPSLKRIFLWEGFPGHPLRKDYLSMPGGYKPGLQRFPYEFPEGQTDYPYLGRTPHADLMLGTAHLEAEATPELAGPPPTSERPVQPTAGLIVPTGEEPGRQAARSGKETDLEKVEHENEDDVP
jgi:NADH-quinone oxidoreductase subunit C